jgi:hypothetical protein
MSHVEEIKQLKNIIFNMLNFTNIYTLVLDKSMKIKFANNSLAKDLGFDTYKELLGRYWLEFISEKEKENVREIHSIISNNNNGWEKEYKECRNNIISKTGEMYSIYWFNSYINSEYRLTLSFGIKKEQVYYTTIDSVRNYYQEIINRDRVMINSIRNLIGCGKKEKELNCEI